MSDSSLSAGDLRPRQPLTFTTCLILFLAAVGFAFDIYEILMAQFIVGPAMAGARRVRPNHRRGQECDRALRSLLVYIPALAGGVFGLIGGYLTDLLGRRRVLTWSIILYAVSAFLAGFSTSVTMLLILRSLTFIGVCVEFVAAVAWLAELFDNPKQREQVLGYTQAFSSLGGLLVAIAFGICSTNSKSFFPIVIPEFLSWLGTIDDAHAPWRYTLMSGLFPALPLILIRPFLPESPKWKQKKDDGTLKRPSIAELFAPAFRAHHHRHHSHVRLCLRCSFWRHSTYSGDGRRLAEVQARRPEDRDCQNAGKAWQSRSIENRVRRRVRIWDDARNGRSRRSLLARHLRCPYRRRRLLLRLFQLPGLVLFPLVFYFFLEMDNRQSLRSI